MSRCRPKVLAERVGFQWPTVEGAEGSLTSSLRASSPRLEQGGRVKTLIRGVCSAPVAHAAFTPQSGFDCRRLAPPDGSTTPTTPASAGVDRSLSLAPPPVPSVAAAPSAAAEASHVPAAPARPLARRRWSAYADDSGRSAFPLRPPSFAPEGWPAERAFISSDDAAIAFRQIHVSLTPSAPRRPS